MNLSGIDLNLLLVFDAVMQERHVTRAGNRIGMSQPAMSNALGRLRHHLKDELFVRSHEGMRPTARALELEQPISDALRELEAALEPAGFDPSTAARLFSIGTNDYCVSILIPKLVERLEREAPGINIRLVSSAGQSFDMLDAREIDFGISAFGDIPDRFGWQLAIRDEYVLVMRKGHPLSKGDLSLEDFVGARHMIVSPTGQMTGFVDELLEERGLGRQVALVVNSFAAAPPMLAQSDLLLTAPKRIVETFAPLYALVSRPAPFPEPEEYSSVKLVWHKRLANHPAYTWFREQIAETAATL